MSGSTKISVSTLIPRSNPAGAVVVGYDPANDTFITLTTAALTGLQGPQGIQGPAGPQGIQGVPGSAGINGKTILNGDGPPAGSLGTNGDFYLDITNKNFYGPKANGLWPAGFSIVGPQGPQGIQGPAGTGGGGGTANLDNGTADGQVAVWNQSLAKYQPQTGTAITGDRTPTVELNAATALTFVNHNRRNVVLSANAPLTLAVSEVGTVPNQGFECVINNDHTAVNQITFAAGLTVNQPAAGTGTGGIVKIGIGGTVAVQVYPKGATLIAKVRGDVA